MLSSGTTCYHLGLPVIIWDAMLSSGTNVIIWDKMLSSGANVIMVSSGPNVIIWCYHVMLSSGMITHPPFLFFLKTSLTPLMLNVRAGIHFFLCPPYNWRNRNATSGALTIPTSTYLNYWSQGGHWKTFKNLSSLWCVYNYSKGTVKTPNTSFIVILIIYDQN